MNRWMDRSIKRTNTKPKTFKICLNSHNQNLGMSDFQVQVPNYTLQSPLQILGDRRTIQDR